MSILKLQCSPLHYTRNTGFVKLTLSSRSCLIVQLPHVSSSDLFIFLHRVHISRPTLNVWYHNFQKRLSSTRPAKQELLPSITSRRSNCNQHTSSRNYQTLLRIALISGNIMSLSAIYEAWSDRRAVNQRRQCVIRERKKPEKKPKKKVAFDIKIPVTDWGNKSDEEPTPYDETHAQDPRLRARNFNMLHAPREHDRDHRPPSMYARDAAPNYQDLSGHIAHARRHSAPHAYGHDAGYGNQSNHVPDRSGHYRSSSIPDPPAGPQRNIPQYPSNYEDTPYLHGHNTTRQSPQPQVIRQRVFTTPPSVTRYEPQGRVPGGRSSSRNRMAVHRPTQDQQYEDPELTFQNDYPHQHRRRSSSRNRIPVLRHAQYPQYVAQEQDLRHYSPPRGRTEMRNGYSVERLQPQPDYRLPRSRSKSRHRTYVARQALSVDPPNTGHRRNTSIRPRRSRASWIDDESSLDSSELASTESSTTVIPISRTPFQHGRRRSEPVRYYDERVYHRR